MSLQRKSESDLRQAYRTLPDQVPHPPLAISASIIKSEMNCPDPCIHNPPTGLEEGRRMWPPMNRYKQGGNDYEKNRYLDMARMPKRFFGGEKPGYDGQRREISEYG